eukprot:m.118596 g.118596  ORF g.118596 m.118596 type:complete len:800 (+) comp10987_c0_seq1:276-2675(+)
MGRHEQPGKRTVALGHTRTVHKGRRRRVCAVIRRVPSLQRRGGLASDNVNAVPGSAATARPTRRDDRGGRRFYNVNTDARRVVHHMSSRGGGGGGAHEPMASHTVSLTLWDDTGAMVARGQLVTAASGTGTTVLKPSSPLQTWSPQTPVTYTLTASIADSGDTINVTTAARVFTHADKASLNGHQIELQGFSHHPSFAGMGAMTNPRLALFLVQTTKALGVNFWRNSHNPYEDAVYDMLDTLGIMCWDENRNMGTDHAGEYRDMIKSHRHHPAIMLWGLCNEAQCGVEEGAAARAFLAVKNELDPDRPQTANSVSNQEYNFPYLDIIGESGSAELLAWHTNFSNKSVTSGEHGFGNDQLWDSRGPEDRALVRLGPNITKVFDPALANHGEGWNNLPPKMTIPILLSSHGLGMWAMMDYYGEAFMGWPTMVKPRGHLDVAGFPRSTSWWYRTNYLANDNVTMYQKPLVGGDWKVQVRAMTPCQMFASTPTAKVLLDGVEHGKYTVNEFGLVDLRQQGAASWPPGPGPSPANVTLVKQASVTVCSQAAGSFGGYDGLRGMWVDHGCRGTFECDGQLVSCACVGSQGYCNDRANCSCEAACNITATNVTVIGMDNTGQAVGSHSLLAATTTSQLELVVDVPSPMTGTGSALYLDGQDVAFIRAQLVDAAGTIVRDEDVNVTYRVESGPVRIVGVGSGSIRNHQYVQGDTYETWQGLGRVVVQATVDCTGEHRDMAAQIDVQADPSTYASDCPTGDAVIVATAGHLSASVKLAVSGDRSAHPLEVARATRSLDTFTYFDNVQP